jgi:hypothetical protein
MKKNTRSVSDEKHKLRTGNKEREAPPGNGDINSRFQIEDALMTMLGGFHIPCGMFMINLPDNILKRH